MLEEIAQLENHIDILEYKREYELAQALKREHELRESFQEELDRKDKELQNSKNQVNQLLRIIEQITKTKRGTSSADSKSSGVEDGHKIIIQEKLEISEDNIDRRNIPSAGQQRNDTLSR